MATTVIGIFDDAIGARRALEAVRDGPLHLDDISLISRDTENGEVVSNNDDVSAGEGAAVGTVWGAVVGGVASLLIPGIGPFVAGGVLFAALTGAVTGAVVGGITAALVDFSGIPEAEAREYERLVHEGKTLVAVRTSDEDAKEVERTLVSMGADEMYDTTDQGVSSRNVSVSSYGSHDTPIHENTAGVQDVNPSMKGDDTVPMPDITNVGLGVQPFDSAKGNVKTYNTD